LPTGVARGVSLTAGELKEMIDGYYQARGLDENGFVPQEKLQKLGLKTKQSIQGDERDSPKFI
jgi:aldehyde:ferredoxin oxidoreductase